MIKIPFFDSVTIAIQGNLLVADPFLKDPNFLRSVVYMCAHNEDGSFGFVLNQLLDLTLDELIEELPGCLIPVFQGGPVQPETLHYIHRRPEKIPHSTFISNGIYHGGDFEVIKSLLSGNQIPPTDIRFFLGYSGWTKGQLSNEIEGHKSWLISPGTQQLVFHNETEQIWPGAIRQLGSEYEPVVHYPIDPQLN